MTGFPARPVGHLRLLLGGDLMLGRGIDFIRPIHNDPEFGKSDARHPNVNIAWAEARGLVVPRTATAEDLWGEALGPIHGAQADLTLFNLETAVTTANCWRAKTYNFRMHPAGLDALNMANIRHVSLANNHVLDFGLPGLLDTLCALRQHGITAVGAGLNSRAASMPAVTRLRDGRRLLMIGVACCNAGCRPWEAAKPHRPGIALLPDLQPASASALARHIRNHRQPDDLVVVSIHWGGNWPDHVPESMRNFAHQLVQEAEVNLVHGHSSHGPMEVERINQSLVLYGCGDVINDYEGRPDFLSRRADLGALFVVDFEKSNLHLTAWHPLVIRRQAFGLKLANASDQRLVKARLQSYNPDVPTPLMA